MGRWCEGTEGAFAGLGGFGFACPTLSSAILSLGVWAWVVGLGLAKGFGAPFGVEEKRFDNGYRVISTSKLSVSLSLTHTHTTKI